MKTLTQILAEIESVQEIVERSGTNARLYYDSIPTHELKLFANQEGLTLHEPAKTGDCYSAIFRPCATLEVHLNSQECIVEKVIANYEPN